MKSRIILISVLAFLFVFQSFLQINAQSDLRKDSSFFLSKRGQIQNWLEKSGIGQLFTFKDFQINKYKLYVNFNSSYSSPDSTLAAMSMINHKMDSVIGNTLEQRLFNMLAFELEIGKDSLEVVLGANLKSNRIPVYYKKEDGVVTNYDKVSKKYRTFKPIVIQMEDIAVPVSSSVSTNNLLTIKDIRKLISDFLKKYYSSKGTFFYNAQLDILKENTNELTFEISKLSKEILTDRNYFEFIRIEIKVLKNDKEVEIRYQIQGKYSGGFGFAPRRSEYRNMEPDFADYLLRYEEKMAQQISQLLTK